MLGDIDANFVDARRLRPEDEIGHLTVLERHDRRLFPDEFSLESRRGHPVNAAEKRQARGLPYVFQQAATSVATTVFETPFLTGKRSRVCTRRIAGVE